MKIDEFKSDHMKTIGSIDAKISAITSNKPSSYSEQQSADITKWPLLKSPDKSSHISKLTKHLSFLILEGDTLLQLHK